MSAGRKADGDRRRQRVVTAVNAAAQKGSRITVSGIARQAGVDRTFLYRHRDLLAMVHAAELEPAERDPASGASAVSRASLQADLANAQARTVRLSARIQQKRLSQELGEQARRESGLREHLINVQVALSDSPDSIRQVGVDSPVSSRLVLLAMAQWTIARDRWGSAS